MAELQVIIMLRVNNKRIISRLSLRSLKNNRARNVIAVIAIILTAVMFTTVFSVGISMIESFQNQTMRSVGTSSHGGFKFLTWQQYEKVARDSEVKNISYNILIGVGENPELNKTYTEIRYTEEKAAKWSFTMPTTGTLPKEYKDIAASTSVLDALGVPHKLGAKVPLEFTANGIKYEESFNLCGFWEQDMVMGASEVFLSREYCEDVAPIWQEGMEEYFDWDNFSGSVHPSLYFSSSWNIEGQMEALKERCGFDESVKDGVNWAYMASEVDFATILLVGSLLGIIMVSGYLIIYNIFYISVNSDIKFYGLLKTIGTTNKQLKSLVRRQAFLLSLIGIPIGLFIGYLCSMLLIPVVMKATNFGNDFSISLNPVIFAGSVLFTLLTVWISCVKPCKLVGKISPVEAVRYTENEVKKAKHTKQTQKVTPYSMAFQNLGRNSKKTILVVLSLSLSIILLNGTISIVNGFDMDKYIEKSMVSDFYITDATVTNTGVSDKIFNGISKELQQEIMEISGVTEIGSVYMQEYHHILDENALVKAKQILEDYADVMARYPELEKQIKEMLEEKRMYSHLYGIDDFIASKINVLDGELDIEKFQTGNYVIATTFTTEGNGHFYEVGDKVNINYGDTQKEYEVLALGFVPYALTEQHSHIFDVYFIMPSAEFIKQTKETGALKTAFNVKDESALEMEEWVKNYCENVNPTIDYRSKSTYVDEFKETQNTFLMVGGALSFILALIGMLNFINSIVTSIQARKKELAILQAIGMTGKQLKEMLLFEGVSYIILTAIFVLTLGNILNYIFVMAVANQIWFFSYHFVILPMIISVLVFCIFAAVIPVICYKNMRRQSVVEQLRNEG